MPYTSTWCDIKGEAAPLGCVEECDLLEDLNVDHVLREQRVGQALQLEQQRVKDRLQIILTSHNNPTINGIGTY